MCNSLVYGWGACAHTNIYFQQYSNNLSVVDIGVKVTREIPDRRID